MKQDTVTVYQGSDKKWHWQRTEGNKLVSQGGIYDSKSAAVRAASRANSDVQTMRASSRTGDR